MLTLDTSGLVAIIHRNDTSHDQAIHVLEAERGPLVIPVAIMSEIAYFLEERGGPRGILLLLQDISDGAYTLDCGDNDTERIQQLVSRYADLGLGFADSAVIACAERRAGRVFTFDKRHFPVVARGERTITVLPEY